MPIDFPDSPSNGDTYSAGGKNWVYNGSAWTLQGVVPTIPNASVGASQLAADAVTNAKIASGAVTEAKIADSSITTAKIAAGAVVEADIAANAVTTGKLGTDVQLGYRNVIINGGFDVWQRGTTTTVTGTAFLADRFRGAVNGGGGATQSRDTDVPSGQGFLYSWKHAATATNSFMQMGQQIEFVNCKHLQNKTVTISFWAKAINSNAGSTGLSVRTRTIAGVDGTVLFAGSPSATSITLTTSWARYTITKTLPASFGSLTLEFALGSHVSGDGFFLTGVQFEAGAVATPFEFENYGVTLAKCQRYYWRAEGTETVSMHAFGYARASTVAFFAVPNPVPMRAVASAVEFSNLQVGLRGVEGFTVTSGSLISTWRSTLVSNFEASVASGLTSLRPYHLINDSNAAGYLAFSAEL